MKKLSFLLILCFLASSVWADDTIISASVSCRTDKLQPDTNRSDSSKLSIRSDNEAAKSWIKFEITDFAPETYRKAILRLALQDHGETASTFSVSAVNDDYLDNIVWAERDITWNNAPANDTASQTDLLPGTTTLMGSISYPDGTVQGDQFYIDVTDAILADTDGIIQFVLHNGSGLINICTHDHSLGADVWPTLILTPRPAGADYPVPDYDEVVAPTLSELSWKNPDPNDGASLITCDVYLTTDPNMLTMDMVTLAAGENSVAINTTNFPNYGNLADNTMHYWKVDCHDPSRDNMIPGEPWNFYVGAPPAIDAGEDQILWLDGASEITVNLDGTSSSSTTYTVEWTQVTTGAPTVAIAPADADDTSLTITARGDYEFMLTGNDGILVGSDTVRIVVGNDACDASHINFGDAYNEADQNQDCVVDLLDFVALIASDWLGCTDTLTNCN